MSDTCVLSLAKGAATFLTLLLMATYSIYYQMIENNTKNSPPQHLYYYAKSKTSILERIAGYRMKQVEQEQHCDFTKRKQNCSFELLNEYHQRCGYFSTKTSWSNITNGYPFAELTSHMCVLPQIVNATDPAADFYNYVSTNNIKHIVSFGDSQGRRYFLALRWLIRDAGFACQGIKFEKEGFTFGLEYYVDDVDPSLLLPVNRSCKSCASNLIKCTHPNGYSVLVEYISMIMNSKSLMMADKSFCMKNRAHALCDATSQQEFVFKHYFKQDKYPQLMLLFTTFAHDRGRSFWGIDQGLRHLIEILDRHVPSTSSIIWYSTTPFHKDRMYPELPRHDLWKWLPC